MSFAIVLLLTKQHVKMHISCTRICFVLFFRMASKNEIVFRRTKGRYDDCDPDMWDDEALVKAYDAALSNETVEMQFGDSSQISEEETLTTVHEGEMVWSRETGVIGDVPQANSKRKKKKRNKRKHNKANGSFALFV